MKQKILCEETKRIGNFLVRIKIIKEVLWHKGIRITAHSKILQRLEKPNKALQKEINEGVSP